MDGKLPCTGIGCPQRFVCQMKKEMSVGFDEVIPDPHEVHPVADRPLRSVVFHSGGYESAALVLSCFQ